MAAGTSLTRWLQISVLLPAAVALFALTAVFVVAHRREALVTNQEWLSSLAHILSGNCVTALVSGNKTEAEALFRSLEEERSVREAALYDASGRLFAVYRVADAQYLTPVTPGPDGLTLQAGRLVIFRAVETEGRRLGTLFLRWDLRPFQREVLIYAATAGAAALLLMGIVAFFGRFLHQRVSQPILDLAETARAVGDDKNYSVRAKVPAIAELAVLANAINHMLGETQTSQARLAAEAEATRNAQDALRAREQQLRLITDASPALISYIDRTLCYRFANHQYQVWFKRTPEQIVGRTMSEVLGEAAFQVLRPRIERALAGEYVRFEDELPYKDVGARWIDAHYIPHRDDSGSVLGLCVLVVDITERKRYQDALARAHAQLETQNQKLEVLVTERTAKLREVIEELEAFSYSIAHDMRAPLRSMQGYSRVLLEEYQERLDDDGRTYLKRIMFSSDRLDRLIQDVLNYSKIVRGELRLSEVDLHALVEGIITTYPHLQAPTVEITIAGRLPLVHGNEAALTQVVSNLLGNAVKFVAPGVKPRVRIHAEPVSAPGTTSPVPARWIRIWFEDNGIGIPKAAQTRLFGMFQRIHRAEQYDGTGIGLAIVRKGVERMGGTVGVESEEGRGSRFWVQLKAV